MLLRPLVRALIARGISYPQFAELVRESYVDVAGSELGARAEARTQSRLSVITGIHRKEIRRLQALPAADDAPPGQMSLGARLIGVWVGSPAFSDEAGLPKALPRRAAGAAAPSFEDLVESVSKDVRPRTILDEFLRLGIVAVDDEGRVALRTAAFVPETGFEEKAYYFGRNLRDHIAAAAANLEGGREPRFERAVYYDLLSRDSAGALDRMSRELGTQALVAMNRAALQRAEADEGRADARSRITFGIFFHSEEEDAPSVSPSETDRGGRDVRRGRG
jgi:hypothetical protein